MIRINGRDINLDSLKVKVERRRARGLLRKGEEEVVGQASLDRGSSVEAQTYFGLQYRLQKSLALHGARLEPPLDYGKANDRGGFFGKLGRLRLKIRRRAITGPGEGYVQQQEQFNTFAVKSLESAARLFQSMRQEAGPGEGREAGVAVVSAGAAGLEDWREEAVAGLLGATRGKLAFIGLPGTAAYEKLLEQGRLLAGVDSDDETVAHYQSLFLPVRWQNPLDFLRGVDLDGCGVLVINQPEEFSYEALDQLMEEAVAVTGPETEVLLRVSRDGWISPGGFVRASSLRSESKWTAEFLAWLLERHGYAVQPVEWAGARFLRGTRAVEAVVEAAEETVAEEAAVEAAGEEAAAGGTETVAEESEE